MGYLVGIALLLCDTTHLLSNQFSDIGIGSQWFLLTYMGWMPELQLLKPGGQQLQVQGLSGAFQTSLSSSQASLQPILLLPW